MQFEFDNFIPGDTVDGNFELTNDESVDMSEIILHSTEEDVEESDNEEDTTENAINEVEIIKDQEGEAK